MFDKVIEYKIVTFPCGKSTRIHVIEYVNGNARKEHFKCVTDDKNYKKMLGKANFLRDSMEMFKNDIKKLDNPF